MLSRKARRPRRAPVFALRHLTLAFAVATLAAGASGCGDSDDAASGDAFAEGDTTLSVTLDPDGPEGRTTAMTEEVSCEDGADDAICRAAAAVDVTALAPVSPDTACTEIFGGPDTASIEGSIDGENVNVQLTRGNGCEIERFDAALPLLRALFSDYEPGGAISGG